MRQLEGDVPVNRLQIACIIRRSACSGAATGLFLPRCLAIDRLIILPFTGAALLIGVPRVVLAIALTVWLANPRPKNGPRKAAQASASFRFVNHRWHVPVFAAHLTEYVA
jgi:hypothetical protein